MGVVHKLKPEVIKFIIDNKQANPHLSCRSLTVLILEKFQIEISKSSVNDIFKENKLSMPVGRRQKIKKKKFNMPALPVIESVNALMPNVEPEKLVLKEEVRVEKAEEESRLKEEQERQEREAAERKKAEEDAIEKDLLSLQKIKEDDAKQKESARIKAEEESRLKEEQERQEREAGLKAERERWMRLAEDESKQKEALKAAEPIKKEEANPARIDLPVLVPIKQGAKPEPLPVASLSGECTGVVLLKAIDYLLRGSAQLSEAIQKRLGCPKEEVDALTQTLIFQGIVGNKPGALSSITRNEISADKLSGYFAQLEEIKTIKLDLSRLSAKIFTEARGIKMHFIDGSIVYLDPQMHTVWLAPYMSHDFSATITNIKDCVNRYFFKDGDLVLFMAPGYDIPTKAFFTLLFNFNSKDKTADNLILYGNNLNELENIVLNPEENHNLLFGLWPWQFTTYRKVKRIGEFSSNHIDCMNKDFYLAEIEIDLIEPTTLQPSTLKGCAVKLNLSEKIRFVVLSTDGDRSLVSLANSYLCRWPNLEECFHDFSRKIELFSRTGETQEFFTYEDLPIGKDEPTDLKAFFSGYAEALDAYLRWHFMPSRYKEAGFEVTRGRFYAQKAQLMQSKDKIEYFLTVTPDYAYAKDLEYIYRRLNERDIRADDGRRIYFESGFK